MSEAVWGVVDESQGMGGGVVGAWLIEITTIEKRAGRERLKVTLWAWGDCSKCGEGVVEIETDDDGRYFARKCVACGEEHEIELSGHWHTKRLALFWLARAMFPDRVWGLPPAELIRELEDEAQQKPNPPPRATVFPYDPDEIEKARRLK